MTITYGTIIEARADAKRPPVKYAAGYGAKQGTRYWVRLAGDGARWRRVYAMSYGNSASLYVVVRGEDVFLDDAALFVALPAFEVVGTITV